MAPKLTLPLDFKEFIESLNSNKVEYLLIGGHAVAVHGHPRFTKDLDIWLKCDRANAERVVKAIHDFGFESLGLTTEDFVMPNQVVQMGHPPLRIDLSTGISGVDFDRCWSARITVESEGIPISVIDVANLKRNKRASGRPQDLADVDHLE